MIAAALAALVAVLPFAAGDTGMPYAIVPTAAERGGLADRLVTDLRSAGRSAVRGRVACDDVACARLAVALDRRLAAASGRAAVGSPAPRFVVDGLDGREISLDSFRGRPLVINVFAAWCGSCREELPRFARAYARHADRVAFLAVDEQEGPSVARAFAHRMGVRFPIAVDDGPMAAAYGATTIPETIVIDAHGTVRAISLGEISEDALERAVARVAATGGNA